jgi:hypothetical protein
MEKPGRYRSYLLRLWETGSDEKAVWRASLENPMTQECQSFASLKALFAFLEAQTDGEAGSQPETDAGCSIMEDRPALRVE